MRAYFFHMMTASLLPGLETIGTADFADPSERSNCKWKAQTGEGGKNMKGTNACLDCMEGWFPRPWSRGTKSH